MTFKSLNVGVIYRIKTLEHLILSLKTECVVHWTIERRTTGLKL